MNNNPPFKIVSGGQTGVDRAALDFALNNNIPCGGWCPKNRRAEDGQIPPKYPLRETPSKDVSQRTEWNIRDSDGTLVITFEKNGKGPADGTRLTVELARSYQKPLYILNPQKEKADPEDFLLWLKKNRIKVLNIAGPRESFLNGVVYNSAYQCLSALFKNLSILD